MNKHVEPVRAIFLVGFMGAGKTSVGQVLAAKLGWVFEDLDDRIQGRTGQTVEEIFETSGEAEFRRHETEVLREVLSNSNALPRVIALGGGAFVQDGNFALLNQSAAVSVFLTAPVDDLYRRCQQQDLKRPLRQDMDQFRKLYEIRRPMYERATIHIETAGKSISAIAAEIIEAFAIHNRDLANESSF